MVNKGNKTPRSNKASKFVNKSYVCICMFDRYFYALADSGSPVSLIDETALPPNLLNNLEKTDTKLEGANGSTINIIGTIKTNITIPQITTPFQCHLYVVKNLCETLLIGTDFMTEFSCAIDFSDLSFKIKENKIPLLKTSNSKLTSTLNVTTSRTITIPPQTIAHNVRCNVVSKKTKQKPRITNTGLFEPCDTLLHRKFNIQSPGCQLVNFQHGTGNIQLTNDTDHEITIYRNQIVGKLTHLNENIVNSINTVHLDTVNPLSDQNRSNDHDEHRVEKFDRVIQKLELDSLSHLSVDQIDQIKNLIKNYTHIFYEEEDGELPAANLPEHEIKLDTQSPIRVPFRQIPMALKGEAEKLVKKMRDLDIIEPATNSPYHSPAFVIKRGSKYKIVVDYRAINKHVIRNFQPLPTIDTITSVWHNCNYWSTLDLHHAYYQLSLKKSSRPISATSIPGVAYWQFKRVPLGISSAVGYFQSQIESTLLGIKNLKCVAYMDDIATGSDTFDSMLSNLQQIFDRLSNVGLMLKPEKTKLMRQELVYLGYKLSQKGLEISTDKTEAITKMTVPRNKKEVKSFVGFCSFFRKFIKSFSSIVKPLTELSKKDVRFKWGSEQQNAYDTIRQKLIEAPILKFPDLTKQFYLTCDASSIGIGSVLQQEHDNFLHPIYYASNALTKTQQKWSSFQREFYALKFYCQKFRHFLLNKKFTVRTDNQALVNWQTFKDFENPKLWRWFTTLSQFEFDIQYIPSLKNESDGPSRLPRTNDPNFKPDIPKQVNMTSLTEPTVGTLNVQELEKAQQDDETIKLVTSWVKSGQKPNFDNKIQKLDPITKTYYNSFNRLKLHNNILYRTWEKENKECPNDPICVPTSMTAKIIDLCHNIPTGGHLGKPKTLSKIRSRFYWPKMELEVSLYIDSCQICIKKSNKQKPKSPLQPFNGTHPNDIIQFDLLENLPDNPQKFKSILVIVDRFTCWVEAVPLKDTKAHTVARVLLDTWIARHGIPVQAHSDRGPQFTSEVMSIVCNLMGIHKTFTCAYRPMSDGAAEAAVKIVKNLLRGYCTENPEKWPDLLQQVLFAYRTSVHSHTKYSPFFLHRGHSARIPMDILFQTYSHKNYKHHGEYAFDLYKTLKETYTYVQNTLKCNRDFMKKNYDKRSKVVPFKPGQYVYLWRPRPPDNKNKFFNHFFGPYKILTQITDYTYKIDTGNKSRIHPVVPHDLLRPATNYDPEKSPQIEYGEQNLELDHTLEIVPNQETPQDFDQTTNTRPVIFQDLPPPDNGHQMVLRNRANINRPLRYRD